jgi:hypothetical protein
MGYASESFQPAIERVYDLVVLYKVLTKEWEIDVPMAVNLFLLSIQRSATIPHDYVYGLFGLIAEFLHLGKEPDYALTPERVYAATSNEFMKDASCLCLLPYARPHLRQTSHAEGTPEIMHELPSWCPDWSTVAWNDYFDIFNHGGFTADNNIPYNGVSHCDIVLKLEGVHVDTVTEVGSLITDMKTSPSEYVPIVEEWVQLAEAHEVGSRALWELFHVATHKDVGLEKIDLQAKFWEFLKGLAEKGVSYSEMKEAVFEEPHHQFCAMSMGWLDKRAIFGTEPFLTISNTDDSKSVSAYKTASPKGSIGMSLPHVQKGDGIFIVKGGRTPLIFRALSDGALREKAIARGISKEELDNCWTFVGVCYIHGMMQGQALAESPDWTKVYLL